MSDLMDPYAYNPQGIMYADGKDHTFDYIRTEDVDSSLNDLFLEPITSLTSETQVNNQHEPVHQVPGQYTVPNNEPQGYDSYVPCHSAYSDNVNHYPETTHFRDTADPMLAHGMYPEFNNVEPAEPLLPETPAVHRTEPPKRYKTKNVVASKVLKAKKTTIRRPRRASSTEQRVVPEIANVQQRRAEDLKEKKKAAVRKCRKKMADYLENAPKEIDYKNKVLKTLDGRIGQYSQLLDEFKMIQARAVPQAPKGRY